ncbi:hypothetical protein [Streptomyces sp. IB2014 016-6]|uniref:hypothetical protein n=1 Tax=Streptomyces sp. IB2014 016-6 TaxID=2517818 RepID=UPI0011CBBC5D|nr:hypothetical protein [Streptomyces sp. IB2014 016-6]TXL91613.1 hypothetical protein EW053_04610 [Streptomyces sp. IB2014 016-6]
MNAPGADWEAENEEMTLLLGHIVRKWTDVELALRSIAAMLVNSPHANTIVAGRSAGDLRRMCSALSKVHPLVAEDSANVLSSVLKRVDKAGETRNHFVHGIWSVNAESMAMLALRSRYWKVDLEPKDITAEELKRFLDEISEIFVDLIHWIPSDLVRADPLRVAEG